VRVRAVVATAEAAMRASREAVLQLEPGREDEVELAFADDIVVQGTVRQGEAPVARALVRFSRSSDTGSGGTALTDAAGHYEIAGLEAGRYDVNVQGPGARLGTETTLTSSTQLDLDVTGAVLRGLVRDAAGGKPLAGVAVSLWREEAAGKTPAASFTTDATGAFRAEELREGRYRVLTSKAGYGQEVQEIELPHGGEADVQLELSAADGLGLQVVDGRDGRPLDAIVVVRDAAKHIVANQHAGVQEDGSVTLALAPGAYVLSTSASGYGTATLPVSAPGRGLRVPLLPGGTLVIDSGRDLRGKVRLVRPDGEDYIRCWCNGIADITVRGRHTSVPNITAGAYTLEMTDEFDKPAGTQPVAIKEGETTTVRVE
jgi:5-hydroxyisourate hydrolase-like protein (transthyretin family)